MRGKESGQFEIETVLHEAGNEIRTRDIYLGKVALYHCLKKLPFDLKNAPVRSAKSVQVVIT